MGERRIARMVAQFLIGVLVVVAVAEVAARIAEAAGPPALRWYDASTQLKVEQMDALGGAEVVFAGTSMVWQGFDPVTYVENSGRSAFNAGLAGGVPVVMEPWLLDEVIPRTHPDTVVWGLSSLDFSASYGADNLDRYLDALETRPGNLAAVERSTAELSALVRYRTVLREPSSLLGNEKRRIDDDFAAAERILGDNGVRRDFAEDTSERRRETLEARVRDFTLDGDDIAAIYRTVRAMQAMGIEVVFAEMPVPDRFVLVHPSGDDDLAQVHEATVALADRLGVEVIDLRAGFTDADFVDFTHLNETGSQALTAALAARMRSPATAADGNAPPPDSAEAPDREALLVTTQNALAVNDAVFGALSGNSNTASTELWYSALHYGRTRDMAVSRAGGERQEVLFIGSSMTVSGANPPVFTEVTGATAFNAGLRRISPEILDGWVREAVPLADPDVVVWGIAPQQFDAETVDPNSCAGRDADWYDPLALRAAAFGGVDVLADFDFLSMSFGDPSTREPPDAKSPLHRYYRRTFTEDGGRQRWPSLTDEEMETAYGALVTRFERYYVCEERVLQWAESLRWLDAQGVDVVVVAMPLSDRGVSAFPGGRDRVAEILARAETEATAAGAKLFLDLSDTIPDERFRDLSHLNKRGSEKYTTRVANELVKRGLIVVGSE